MRKRLILTVLVVVALLLSWILWIAVTSYIRAPGIVAELDRAGVLPFSPSELPRGRICALLVADQDATFYRHQGIGIADGPLGHTTITQSIGKGLFFDGFSPGLLHHRKIRLMVAAWAFDRRISKETQLRLFLNRAYFGRWGGQGVIGFPAAASAFYGKPLGQLSDSEYFGLLAMLAAPNSYHVLLQPQANAERVARIREQVQRACGDGCFQGDAPIPCATTSARH
jgi:membrane carboxypeptidase/penicillin-binding protein